MRDYARGGRGTGRRVNSQGYVELRLRAIGKEDEAMFNQMRGNCRFVLEHRWVMAKLLGRALLPGENVHHKRNGDRANNRPDNLELWTTQQPTGGRAEDQVQWAREILHRYGSLFPE
jgi:hypothetical protein